MPQRYERVAAVDDDDSLIEPRQQYPVPSSPPPSFRSRASSPTSASRRLLSDDPLESSDAERTLADTFDSPSDDEGSGDENDDGLDDRQRLMRANTSDNIDHGDDQNTDRPGVRRQVTQLPVFPTSTSRGPQGGGSGFDGVFANMSAKPARGDDADEKPPSYEQAAADATPPYWETTILAPGMLSDEVVIDGLPVGSLPSLFWNFMITIAFPVVGFLLTYLLHTTHAAKRGSFAGLGVVLIQYGFSMKGVSDTLPDRGGADFGGPPQDPNSHDFNPGDMQDGNQGGGPPELGLTGDDLLAYGTMVVGWFILIKSLSDFLKARRQEQIVLLSPERNALVEEAPRGEQAV